ncbi:2-keto-4-pentenoate hydratase [Aquicoccus sp.]|uniref:2-keto-4-pentenoate hydratase n=1 Tax=Aquicoccus sp. TaxID=2055851 RepID=UPI0035627648
MEIETIGRALAEARRTGRKLEEYPCVRPDMGEALAIQGAMTAAMGAPVVGWKVGLTSLRAQELCGVDAPLAGPLFEGSVWDSGVEIAPVEGDLGILEAEIGLRMQADLPPRAAPYERAEVLAAVGEVLPVIEWVNKRLPGGIRDAAEWLAADGVINRGVICGAGHPFNPDRDLAGERVTVRRDDVAVTEGVGANAMGGPDAVIAWLANDLSARGIGLRRGDVVATGLICDVVHAVPGARIEADFMTLGPVAVAVAG